jgi:hypothetical protein
MTELPEDPSTFAANLAQAQAKVGQDPIWFWRGHAINAFAVLEASLCALLSTVGEMKEDVAGVIFYKITSAGSRNNIIELLIKKKCGSKYNIFWNSFLKGLGQIDNRRNQIVHWAAMTEIKDLRAASLAVEITFRPGNYWDSLTEPDPPKLVADDLRAFIERCGVYSKMISLFVMLIRGHVQPEHLAMWGTHPVKATGAGLMFA